MVDPIFASDGETYDRFSAFSVIDNNGNMPGCAPGTFKIVGEVAIQHFHCTAGLLADYRTAFDEKPKAATETYFWAAESVV